VEKIKVCKKCLFEGQSNLFIKNDMLCKECGKIRDRQYYADNKSRILNIRKAKYADKRSKIINQKINKTKEEREANNKLKGKEYREKIKKY